ncbi:MAG: hypothetical protein LRS49_05905 [Desulfurococcales archaeon]|nr:hypothetical protein [Desulfurococcales archaeon]
MGKPILLAVFRSLWPMSFRVPGPFEAGVHGPATSARSEAYPPPSTMAGALAAALLGPAGDNSGGHSQSATHEIYSSLASFKFTENQLKRLGNSIRIYTGLAVGVDGPPRSCHAGPNGLYVHTGEGVFMPLGKFKQLVAAIVAEYAGGPLRPFQPAYIMDDAVRRGAARRVETTSRIGIGLQRRDKSVEEHMLYVQEMVDYSSASLAPAALIDLTSNSKPKIKPPKTIREVLDGKTLVAPAVLGGEGRASTLEVSRCEKDPGELLSEGNPRRGLVAAALISPALIGVRKPVDIGRAGEPVVLDTNLARGIAEKLLKAAEKDIGGIAKSLEPVTAIMLHKRGVEARSIGWDIYLDAPRPPAIVVPPGTILVYRYKASGASGQPSDIGKAARVLARKGLGELSHLGWGTVVTVAL